MSGIAKKGKIEVIALAGTDTYIPQGTSRTGTVSTTSGSKIVTGVGTLFCSELEKGDKIIIEGDLLGLVERIDSDTSLRLKEDPAVTKSDVTYTLVNYGAMEFVATGSALTIEGEAWPANIVWDMKNDYGIDPVLFGGTGTVYYMRPTDIS